MLATSALALWVGYVFWPFSPASSSNDVIDNRQGLVSQPCWFSVEDDWPAVSCYKMWVPENHQRGTRNISFPVIQFHAFSKAAPSEQFPTEKAASARLPLEAVPSEAAPSEIATQPPVLHLGAGGPGAAMWLHNQYVLDYIWRDFEQSVLSQGRDLFLMDPRGTGMAYPRLNCPAATRHTLAQLKDPQSITQYIEKETQLYIACIEGLQQQGLDVAAYQSLSVIHDLKLLQDELDVATWSLFGVSYGAVYALLFANTYAEHVDTLILDSPAFPALKNLDDPAARFLSAFVQLENYCDIDPKCTDPLENVTARLLQLVSQLDADPITLSFPSGFLGSPLPVTLNGQTFASILFYAVYGHEIYRDIPAIITELEQNDVSTFYGYIDNYVAMVKDQNYSGITMISHLCYDEVPFVDHVKLTAAIEAGLTGFLREGALYTYTWPAAICHVLGAVEPNAQMIAQINTAIPTLFLQGALDTVTPLSDVQKQLPYFSQAQLRVYPLAHGVYGQLACVKEDVAAFLKAPLLNNAPATCEFE